MIAQATDDWRATLVEQFPVKLLPTKRVKRKTRIVSALRKSALKSLKQRVLKRLMGKCRLGPRGTVIKQTSILLASRVPWISEALFYDIVRY